MACHTNRVVAYGGLLFFCLQNIVLWKNGFSTYFFLNCVLICFFRRLNSISDLTVLQCYSMNVVLQRQMQEKQFLATLRHKTKAISEKLLLL